jgi:UPF0716 protein FxsA
VWLLLFILVPITEMYLLIAVAGQIGTWPTIALVVLTAVTGVTLLKRQGLATLSRGLGRAGTGELPVVEIAEGLLLAIAGALLLTPGFVTDLAGGLLLVPALRRAVGARLVARVTIIAPAPPGGPTGKGTTIEGEFRRR